MRWDETKSFILEKKLKKIKGRKEKRKVIRSSCSENQVLREIKQIKEKKIKRNEKCEAIAAKWQFNNLHLILEDN